LLGGDYFIDASDRNQPNGVGNLQYSMKREGDKITYYNDSYVLWGGLFGQAEYKKNDWSAFGTVTYSETAYQRVDHFLKRDVILDDGTVIPTIVGYNETYYTNGTQNGVAKNGAVVTVVGDTTFINNPSGTDYKIANAKGYSWDKARMATTDRKWFTGYTAKGGANYNLDDHQNVFVNVGYMNMAPRFNNVFDNSNKVFLGIENQRVYAVEAGYGQRYRKFAANLNVYYTYWHNKPPDFTPTVNIGGDVFSYNINGMNAVHKGVELDFHYSPINKVQIEGLASIGDWRYDAAERAYIYDQDERLVDSVDFSARGVHVGNAAQTQLGISVRYEFIKRLYVKARYTRFDRHWANFDPLALAVDYDTQGNIVSDNRDRQSWMLPGYGLLDLFAGYDFKYFKIGKNNSPIRFTITASVTNVLDTIYIADGSNGAYFDANSSTVYMGLGRRWTTGLKLSF
jgi:outer membrane receptor protein involved in Fe transport